VAFTEQQRTAIDKANEIRVYKARMKEWLADMPRSQARDIVLRIIREPRDFELSFRAGELVGAIPHVGPSRVRKVMVKAGVGPEQKLRDMSVWKRHRLADEAVRVVPADRVEVAA
jgi:hypothetical protein